LSRLDELYRLHRLLDGRRTGLSRADLIGTHGFARSTLARLIRDLRDKLGAPLDHDANRGGYLYNTANGRFDLPGLWFTADELLALVTLKHLLAHLEPGLLDDHLRPLQIRIDQLLASRHPGAGEASRIRLLRMAARRKNPRHFQTVAGAVLQRKRPSSTTTTANATKPAAAKSPRNGSRITATTGTSTPGATGKKRCAALPSSASAP